MIKVDWHDLCNINCIAIAFGMAYANARALPRGAGAWPSRFSASILQFQPPCQGLLPHFGMDFAVTSPQFCVNLEIENFLSLKLKIQNILH